MKKIVLPLILSYSLIQAQPPVLTEEQKNAQLIKDHAISTGINFGLFSSLFLISVGTLVKLTNETEKSSNNDIEYRESRSIADTTVKYLEADENRIEVLERYKKFVSVPIFFSLIGTVWNSIKLSKSISISVKPKKTKNSLQVNHEKKNS